MSDDEAARRKRADELRRRLREAVEPAPGSSPADSDLDTSEMLPGESPNDSVQRRMREIDRQRPSG